MKTSSFFFLHCFDDCRVFVLLCKAPWDDCHFINKNALNWIELIFNNKSAETANLILYSMLSVFIGWIEFLSLYMLLDSMGLTSCYRLEKTVVGDCSTTKITVAKCNELVAFEIAVDMDRVCNNWQAVAIFKASAILLLGCGWMGSVFVIIQQLTVSSWWKSQICLTLHPQKFIIKQKFKDFFSNTDLCRYITRIQPDGKRLESSLLLQKQLS